MKIKKNEGQSMPTAAIAINKSRLKVYDKHVDMPTYYLQKGQEFQLELFNPTKDTILAKIFLNNKSISQGGLVIKPGQRVFLDRYLDVAKKFLFDTYEVEDTSEVKKAIEDNGDFKVEFYKEFTINPYTITYANNFFNSSNNINGTYNQNLSGGIYGSTTSNLKSSDIIGSTTTTNVNYSNNSVEPTKRRLSIKKSKSVETGRVEVGSSSEQKITTVTMSWETFPFHSVNYKMLPLSQKVISSDDIYIKRYCVNCGSKLSKGNNFCGQCGSKA